MPEGVIYLLIVLGILYLLIKLIASPRSSSNDYYSDPSIQKSENEATETNIETETSKVPVENKVTQMNKVPRMYSKHVGEKEYTKKEILDILSSDENFRNFLNSTIKSGIREYKSSIQRHTVCWHCHRPLSSNTNKVCDTCGWLVCNRCGSCNPRCSRTENKEMNSRFSYYYTNRRKIFNYMSNNIDIVFNKITLSQAVYGKALLEYIYQNEHEVFGIYKPEYDSEGFDQHGYDRNGYDREGFNRKGYNRTGFNKYGYNMYGYDLFGYNQYGYNKRGYDKEGYDQKGFDVHGYDRNGLNKEGYDKEGYDKAGYDSKGFDRYGTHKNGTLYDDNGFNKEGYDREKYDRRGYNTLGYNRNGFDIAGYDITGFDIDGFDINGYDKEGYDKKGFNINGYNRNGFDKTGYDKDKYNEYGYNDDGFTKDGVHNDWIGVKVEHISCGKGRIFGFYNSDGQKYFVVRYDSTLKKDGKFLFSESVLSILKFVDFTPNFNE